MVDRKLISCVGYSLRLAKRSGQEVAAEHLWHGLNCLIQGKTECSGRPLCLFTALGFDEAVDADPCQQPITDTGDVAMSDVDSVQVSAKPSQKEVACCEAAAQTEVSVISMVDFHSFLARFQKDLEERLLQNLQPHFGQSNVDGIHNALSSSLCAKPSPGLSEIPPADDQTPAVDPQDLSMHVAETSVPHVEESPSAVSVLPVPDSPTTAKRRRRVLRQQELERMAAPSSTSLT